MTAARTAPPAGLALVGANVRRLFTGSPGRLRLAGAAAVGACLLMTLIGTIAVRNRQDAISDARTNSSQLVRIQDVRTSLVEAHASATNAFLVGGLEPSEQRAAYEDRLAAASSTLAVAAGGSRQDAEALGPVNDAISRYSGLVESARANNRQGYPVGVAYLRQATSVLQDEVLPALEVATADNVQRVSGAFGDSDDADSPLWSIAVIALFVLVLVQLWLFRRTRRLINPALLLATAILVAGVVVTGAAMALAQSDVNDVRSGASQDSQLLAEARSAAFSAKSDESLTLIQRGSGGDLEVRARARLDAARTALVGLAGSGARALDSLDAYDSVHRQIRALDDGGDWDSAVALATTADDNGSNAAFARFDVASQEALDRAAGGVDNDLHDARVPLGFAWVVVLAAGLVAAMAAWRGIALRLREYA